MSIVKKKQKKNFFNLSNAPQNSSVSRKFTYSYSNFKIDTQKLRIRANPASHHWDLSRYGHWGFSDEYLRKMLPSLRIALWNDSLFVKVISFHYWFSFFLALLFFFIHRVKIFKSLIAFFSISHPHSLSHDFARFFYVFSSFSVVVYISRGFVGTEICIRSG